MTVGIIGLGYVGLTLAIVAADCGVTVYGIEINDHIKDCLRKNRAHFYEPGLDALIEKHNNNSFFCVDEFPADIRLDAVIITVGTPLIQGTEQPNYEYIKSALQSMSNIYNGEQVVILRSTVSVGTTRNVVMPYLASLCGESEDEVLVSMCPERTVEGKAIVELTGLPQIISGNNKHSLEIARKLFSMLTEHIVVADTLEEAELAKLYCNVYRDIMFSLGNMFCMGAQLFGVDGTKVIKTANEGYSRSNIALPGLVAGPCLGKDAYILLSDMPECAERNFILNARRFNESLEDIVVEWVGKNIGAADKTVAVSGMAFKGVPETNDLRGSSSVNIAQKLLDKGYKLKLHDFVVTPEELKSTGLGEPCASIEDACRGVGLLLVLNNHKKYWETNPCADMMRDGFKVLDVWDVCASLRGDGYVRVSTLGNCKMENK